MSKNVKTDEIGTFIAVEVEHNCQPHHDAKFIGRQMWIEEGKLIEKRIPMNEIDSYVITEWDFACNAAEPARTFEVPHSKCLGAPFITEQPKERMTRSSMNNESPAEHQSMWTNPLLAWVHNEVA